MARKKRSNAKDPEEEGTVTTGFLPSRLPIRIDDLLHARVVEVERIEFKAGWNPDPILRTLCAFANDFENLGGGYLVIGQDSNNGEPIFPPVGLPRAGLDKIQRELLQYCHSIVPPYFPIFSIEEFQGKTLVVLWSPGGQSRPYRVPKNVTAKDKDYRYYIRRYANTVEAKNGELRELFSLAATVPFDDRICHRAELDDLKLPLIRSFLKEIRSGLYSPSGKMPLADLARNLNIVEGSDEFIKPRNVGLMFFNDAPEGFFPGTQIDVVVFPEGVAGTNLEEKIFHGPLHQQLRDALTYLRNMVVKERVTKVAGQAEAVRIFNYPYEAIEEALVNAVYHRSYEQREPIEVRVNPDRVEIVSYPGPDPSVSIEALNKKRIVTRRYRNRRIGDFLKELELTEGRGTGIPTMRQSLRANGSPPPRFKTDRNRTSFLAEIPIHPAFLMEPPQSEVPVEAPVEVPVDLNETERAILLLCKDTPKSKAAIVAGLGYDKKTGNVWKALQRLTELRLIELTIPSKPNSKNQKRRITAKGIRALGVLGS